MATNKKKPPINSKNSHKPNHTKQKQNTTNHNQMMELEVNELEHVVGGWIVSPSRFYQTHKTFSKTQYRPNSHKGFRLFCGDVYRVRSVSSRNPNKPIKLVRGCMSRVQPMCSHTWRITELRMWVQLQSQSHPLRKA